MAAYTKTQVFHENLEKERLFKRLSETLPDYKQVQLQTVDMDIQALINKKGKAAIRILPGKGEGRDRAAGSLSHNRKKIHELLSRPVRRIGLDLKKDVIRRCSRLARGYGYWQLHFYEGSIEEFEGVSQVDMVITLHACDTATDGIRASLLEAMGYDTQETEAFCDQFHFDPTLKRLLEKERKDSR